MRHNYYDLISIFNHLFESTEETILVSGGQEPVYIPKNDGIPLNKIIFKEDYYSSALHEIAHWCIASKERRKLPDYGYWYNPHRKADTDQHLFEQAEAKPQALEWIFSMAAGIRFFISADNLSRNNEVSTTFKNNIFEQATHYLTTGLPQRAQQFNEQLLAFYQRGELFNLSCFSLDKL